MKNSNILLNSFRTKMDEIRKLIRIWTPILTTPLAKITIIKKSVYIEFCPNPAVSSLPRIRNTFRNRANIPKPSIVRREILR